MSKEPQQHGPLDKDAYTHQARLLLALHSARPVVVNGRQQFIHTIRAQQAGGRISMDVYLAGQAHHTDVTEIELATPVAGPQEE